MVNDNIDNLRSKKRSHQLAIDNLTRIATTLREERNNALTRIQKQQQQLEEARQLIDDLRSQVNSSATLVKIEKFLSMIGADR